MHSGVGRIGVALLMTMAVLTACAPSPEEIAACQKRFADHRQMLGENGNPGNKEFTPNLTARWDELYAQFEKLGTTATGEDCPDRFKAMAADMKSVEGVLYKIDDYDVERMIASAEADLDHAEELRGSYSTDYVLITLFRTLHERGADAKKSLAPFVARVDAVAPDDKAGRAKAMVALYNAAASDAAFQDFKEARETIGNYELHEE